MQRTFGRRALFALGAALLAVISLLAASQVVSAQETAEPGWLPWTGCWQGVDEVPDAPRTVTCVRMVDEGAAEMLTFEEGQELGEPEVLWADGRFRESVQEGCEGRESAEFSRDGGRIYLRTEHTCQGIRRVSTGLLAMVSPYEWLDVRSIEAGGDVQTWTRRYRWLDPDEIDRPELDSWASDRGLAGEAARLSASGGMSVDDVIEVSARVHEDAVKAWIAEEDDPLEIDAESLVRMAEAGVPGSVTDVLVAVSFPDRFVVSRDGGVDPADRAGRRGDARSRPTRTLVSGIGFGGGWGSYRYRRGYRYYGAYGYDPFYSPWGYGGGYYGGYAYRPTVVYVQPRAPEEAGGRIVNGRGYTRSGSAGSDSGATARPRSGPSRTSGSPSASSGRGGSSSSGGSVSSGGYRGGSSSGSTGRTARPRSNDGGS